MAGVARNESAAPYADTMVSADRIPGGCSTLFNHLPGSRNALFMDPHVKSNRYPTSFPANSNFGNLASFFLSV
jgi:hypothetical protein